ncbi:MAG: Hsp20/alpha crystallin family protein [Nitrospinae bacterium]|nr:Hsp20/alpha crystallin family protein [Nitrospinota bacterium]
MSILRWDPAKDLMFVQDRMSKLFEYVLANLDVDIRFPSPWVPLCDVYENAEGFVLKAEVPGMSLDDMVLDISGNTVTFVGVRKKQKDVSDESYFRIERNYGKFIRNFILPCEVDENSVSASLKDGLLSVTIPKAKTQTAGSVIPVSSE